MKNFYNKGLTLLEVLIVTAIIVLLVSVVLPQFANMRANQVLKSASGDILSAINKARSQTLSSVDSSEYGVHFQSDQVIIFKGKVFSAGAGDNEAIAVFTPATISNVTLGGVSGTSGDMYFNRLYGAPSATGTITVSSDAVSKTITISATG